MKVSYKRVLGILTAVTVMVQALVPSAFVSVVRAEEVVEETPEATIETAEETTPSEVAVEETEQPAEETPEVSETEEPVEETEGTSEEEDNTEIFVKNDDGSYTTVENVTTQEYVFPEDSRIKVNFTSVSEEGTMTIKKIALSEEQQEELQSTLDFVVEITSTMSNGSFEYDLTLPGVESEEDESTEVKYNEVFSTDVNDYENVETTSATYTEVQTIINGLNHFTVFYIYGETWDFDVTHYFSFYDPSPVYNGGPITMTQGPSTLDLTLEADAITGVNTIELRYADWENFESCFDVYNQVATDPTYNFISDTPTFDAVDHYTFTGVDMALYSTGGYVDLCAQMTANDGSTALAELWVHYDPADPGTGVIQGRKFWDANGNGTYENGIDLRLPEWDIVLYWEDIHGNIIELDRMETEDTTSHTNPAFYDGGTLRRGQYRFSNLPAGTYYVCEVLNDTDWNLGYDWVQTRPNTAFSNPNGDGSSCYRVNLSYGQQRNSRTFGNALEPIIYGGKYYDANRNGVFEFDDPNEYVIPGWEIQLWDATGTTLIDTQFTDNNGYYEFSGGLVPGTSYIVREIIPANSLWEASTPEEYTVIASLDLYNNEAVEFGNYELNPASISGIKYEDQDQSGDKADSEPTVADWTIMLFEDGVQIDSTTTDANGEYEFTNLRPGDYCVVEDTSDPEWTNITPASYCYTLAEGDIEENVDFGNYQDLPLTVTIDQGDTVEINLGDDLDLTTTLSTPHNGPVTYTWESSNGQTGTGSTFTFSTASNSTYTVTVTATDFDGDIARDTITINVVGAAPVDPSDPTLTQTGYDMKLPVTAGLLILSALTALAAIDNKFLKKFVTSFAK